MTGARSILEPLRLGLMLMIPLLPEGMEAQASTASRFSRGWQGEPTLSVTVEMASGKLSIHGAPRDVLYDVQLRTEDRSPPSLTHRYTPGHLSVGTDGDSTERSGRPRLVETRGLRPSEVSLDLALGRRSPLDLTVKIGASVARMDLDALPLRSLEISLGAGTLDLSSQAPSTELLRSIDVRIGAGTLTADGLGFLAPERMDVDVGLGQARLGWEGLTRPLTQLSLSIALGQVELRIPESVGISVNRSGFLFRTQGAGLQRAGDRWISDNWHTSPVRLEISAHGALGGLEIVRIQDR